MASAKQIEARLAEIKVDASQAVVDYNTNEPSLDTFVTMANLAEEAAGLGLELAELLKKKKGG